MKGWYADAIQLAGQASITSLYHEGDLFCHFDYELDL